MADTNNGLHNENCTLPSPVFRLLGRDPQKEYCDICNHSWAIKNKKRNNLKTIKKEVLKALSLRWEKTDVTRFNKIHGTLDWYRTNDFKTCVNCRGTFAHEAYLAGKEKESKIECVDNTQSTSNHSEGSVSAEALPVVIRKSSRKRLSYETDRNDDEKASCIICNEEKKEKGRTVPITVITLQDEETKKH